MDHPNVQPSTQTESWPSFPSLGLHDDLSSIDLWDFSADLESLLCPADASLPASKHRAPKSYSGCITCRQRKVKCDEKRPFCGNCERARHYQCQGYGDNGPTNLADCREQGPPRKRVKHTGMAGSFHPDSPQSHVRPRKSATTTTGQGWDFNGQQTPPSSHPRDGSHVQHTQLANGTNTATPRDLSDAEGESDDIGQKDLHSAGFKDQGDALLAYFQNTVCPIMLPSMDAVRNPWLQIYMPMALRKDPSRGRSALRHALRSVAASHLSQNDESRRLQYQEKAKFHRDEAMKILTHLLTMDVISIPAIEKFTLLAAALTLITTHIWGHDPTDCNSYLNLAKNIARASGGERFWKSSALSCALFQLLRIYDVVAATAQLQEDVTDSEHSDTPSEMPTDSLLEPEVGWNRQDSAATWAHHANVAVDDGRGVGQHASLSQTPYILGASFGISSQTMTLLHELIQLRSSYAAHLRSSILPESLLHETDVLAKCLYDVLQGRTALEADLSLASLLPPLAAEETTSITSGGTSHGQDHLPEPVMTEITENYQSAFHHAVVLYFHRVVPLSYFSSITNGETARSQQMRSTPVVKEDCQNLVRKIFDCLENIDCLTGGTKVRPSIALWPVFIAAVEAMDMDLRHRALLWFSKATKRGIGNVSRAKDLVMATWRATDRRIYGDPSSIQRGLGPLDWRLIMQKGGSIIMLA